ncbi:MAG: hypothetical protein DRI73_03660 [Bacteroidetes bacterium]|nr:MAG: hypothetical protein DRI73_03660 [Bacteroidota bacterium]
MNRRYFISSAADTTSIIIIPGRVLGGIGFVSHYDKIAIANIGCSIQGLEEMSGMVENPDIQLVSVCDVSKFSTDCLDWSPNGVRDGIRRM